MPATGPYIKDAMRMGTSLGEYSRKGAAKYGICTVHASVTARAASTAIPQSFLVGMRIFFFESFPLENLPLLSLDVSAPSTTAVSTSTSSAT